MTAADISSALHGRKSGTGYVMKCPGHDDRNPSLSIRDGGGGKILAHCHAGCDQQTVIEALKGLGLWPEQRQQSHRTIVNEYNYTDAAGNMLYQIVRFVPKDFAQRYREGAGWVWKKYPNQVLYRLPEVLEAPIVFLVEGERDVETLRDYGFVATTNAGGAKAAWLPQFTEALCGREVNIVPDNDEPGWNRAAVIARALLGAAARIRILDLPPDVKDITDWFAAGHSEVELISMLEGVHAA